MMGSTSIPSTKLLGLGSVFQFLGVSSPRQRSAPANIAETSVGRRPDHATVGRDRSYGSMRWQLFPKRSDMGIEALTYQDNSSQIVIPVSGTDWATWVSAGGKPEQGLDNRGAGSSHSATSYGGTCFFSWPLCNLLDWRLTSLDLFSCFGSGTLCSSVWKQLSFPKL